MLSENGSNIEKVIVTVNGKIVPFTLVETEDAYVLNISYTHSEHVITIYYATHPLTVKVTSASGQPLANAKVLLSGPNNLEVSGYTDSSSYVVFNKVPAGNFTVKVEYEGLSKTLTVL